MNPEDMYAAAMGCVAICVFWGFVVLAWAAVVQERRQPLDTAEDGMQSLSLLMMACLLTALAILLTLGLGRLVDIALTRA